MAGYKRNPIKRITIEMQDGRVFELSEAEVVTVSMETDQYTTICHLSFLAPARWTTYYAPDEIESGAITLIAAPPDSDELE